MNARSEKILNLLHTRMSVQITELADLLDVSRETIRKDLTELDEQGLLIKVRGGAISKGARQETAYESRRASHQAAKTAIARRAAGLVEAGMTVYIDYGTTAFACAQELASLEELTVVTNSLPVVLSLAPHEHLSIVVPGGVLRSNENAFYGPPTIRNLEHINPDVGIFGCAGVTRQTGASNHHIQEAMVSAVALRRSRSSVLLADASKLGTVAAHTVAPLEDFDRLFTDASEESQRFAEDVGDMTDIVIVEGK